jgi:hypothetical protein
MTTKEILDAKENFVQEYLIDKPAYYGVDFDLFSALRVNQEPRSLWAANIVGVGIGEKFRQGMSTGDLALRVYVVEKISNQITTSSLGDMAVPPVFKNIPTDIIPVGRAILRNVMVGNKGRNTNYIRPVLGGFSVGNVNDNSAGTLGCLVKERNDITELYILSNNHVIARQNQALSGEDIIQPGPFDGGTLPALAKYKKNGNDRVAIDSVTKNTTDAAIAALIDHASVSTEIFQIGKVRGIMKVTEKQWVIKCGRTTGFTRGYVDDANVTLRIPFANGIALFSDQILVRGVPSVTTLSATSAGPVIPFSARGDSGSLIIDETTGYAVGLLFAGSDRYNITYVNKIENVLNQLNVDLVM